MALCVFVCVNRGVWVCECNCVCVCEWPSVMCMYMDVYICTCMREYMDMRVCKSVCAYEGVRERG